MNIFKRRKKKLIVVLGEDPYPDLFKRFGHVSRSYTMLFSVPHTVDMVVLSGGADIHPSLYNGMDSLGMCYTNIKRDRFEQNVLKQCQIHNIKVTGICRGLQLLNVMSGGFMFQHVTNHSINGLHEVYYPLSGERVLTNSYHHQLIGLPEEGVIPIAWADPKLSRLYVWPKSDITRAIDQEEIEAAIFPKLRAMGVQYHPEWMNRRSYGRKHYEAMVKDFLELSITQFTERYGRKTDHVQRSD